jgi:POT family proton-dependent oligopeptide transporter
VVFDAFYWIINFGSFFASLLMPVFLRDYGPAVAFGIPGILMASPPWCSGAAARSTCTCRRPRRIRFLQQRRPHRPAGARAGQARPGLVVAGIGVVGAVARWP